MKFFFKEAFSSFSSWNFNVFLAAFRTGKSTNQVKLKTLDKPEVIREIIWLSILHKSLKLVSVLKLHILWLMKFDETVHKHFSSGSESQQKSTCRFENPIHIVPASHDSGNRFSRNCISGNHIRVNCVSGNWVVRTKFVGTALVGTQLVGTSLVEIV